MKRSLIRFFSIALLASAQTLTVAALVVFTARYAPAMAVAAGCGDPDTDEEECPNDPPCADGKACTYTTISQPGRPTAYRCWCLSPFTVTTSG